MPNTSRFNIPYPASTDQVNQGATNMQAIAAGFDAVITGYAAGTAASRPAAGSAGRIYRATDTTTLLAPNGVLYFDDGTAWQELDFAPSPWQALTAAGGASVSTTTIRAAAARLETGGVVRLRGFINNVTGGPIAAGTTLATIPTGLRPPVAVYITRAPIAAFNSAAPTALTTWDIDITSGGAISLPATAIPDGYVAVLDGVTYTIT